MALKKQRINIWQIHRALEKNLDPYYPMYGNDAVPLTPELRKVLEKRLKDYQNKIRVVHKCYVPDTESKEIKIKNGYNSRETYTVSFFKRQRVKRKVILRYTKKDTDWWKKFPETYKCEDCGFEVSRAEISLHYLANQTGVEGVSQ